MATSVSALKVVISAKDNASSIIKRTGSSFNKLKIASAAALGGIAFGAAKAVDAAIDFESAFAGVRKTVDATEPEFQAMRKEILNLSTQIPVAATELSKIGEIAGQLGVPREDIIKFTKTIADISVATNLTQEQAATDFARIANVMNEPLNNIDKMASSVVFLGNNFATTEVEISEFAQRIAGAGQIAGLTTPQVFAIGAAMSSVGVQAEAGGTAVQKVLIGMNTAVVEGNENLSVFAQTAGMSAEEFRIAFEENAGLVFQNFVQGLGEQGDQAITTLSELGLEDQRLIRAFLSLSNAGDLVKQTMEGSTQAFSDNSALVEEAQKRYETTDSKIQTFKNTVIATIIEAVDPLKESISRNLGKLTEWLKSFDDGDGIIEGVKKRLQEFFQTVDEKTGLITMIKMSFDFLVNTLRNDLLPMIIEHKDELIRLAAIIGGALLFSINGAILAIAAFIKIITGIINALTALRNGLQAGISAVQNFGNTVSNIINQLISIAFSWGASLVSNFIGGITSKIGAAADAAMGVVNSVKGVLGFSTNPNLPSEEWGAEMMDNFNNSILGSLPFLDKTLKGVIDVISVKFDETVALRQRLADQLKSIAERGEQDLVDILVEARRKDIELREQLAKDKEALRKAEAEGNQDAIQRAKEQLSETRSLLNEQQAILSAHADEVIRLQDQITAKEEFERLDPIAQVRERLRLETEALLESVRAEGMTFQKGTSFVPRTGLALLHKGEQVVPAGANASSGGDVTVNFNNPQVRSQSDLDSLVNVVKETLNRDLRLEQIGI